jgi:tRNA pseudouridine32 synthase / 23S rRNA pseudouridine746 synthase
VLVPIVLATPRLVVVDKPRGLLSVPGIGPHKTDCVIARVRGMFPHARGPMMVHRLDMETSGLMVVALDEDAQRELSARFERREVAKRYVALLEGTVAPDQGEVTVPLRLDVDRRHYQIADFVLGRPCRTRFRVLERAGGRTRVEFEPLTGRTHQLRVHSALPSVINGRPGGLGCPIVGDSLYGSGNPDGSGERLALHASYLAFTGPDGQPVEARSAPPF